MSKEKTIAVAITYFIGTLLPQARLFRFGEGHGLQTKRGRKATLGDGYRKPRQSGCWRGSAKTTLIKSRSRQRQSHQLVDVQANWRLRRANIRRTPHAKIRPGSPVPTI